MVIACFARKLHESPFASECNFIKGCKTLDILNSEIGLGCNQLLAIKNEV